MWPFRRKLEAPPAGGPPPAPAPVIRRDWVGLTPIQRVIGAHPLTAPSDQFSADLATHQDPSVSSDTMNHQVSADAPAGLVLALARPTTRSDGPVMIPRPRVQRREVGAVAQSGEWDGDEAAPEPARPTPLPASATAVAARQLPVVAPEPMAQRLTSLPPDAEPVPVAAKPTRASATSRAHLEGPAQSSIEAPGDPASSPAPRLTLGQARRLGLGAPIARVPDRSVQRAASDSTSMPLARPAAEPPRAMPALSAMPPASLLPEALPAMPLAPRPSELLAAPALTVATSPPSEPTQVPDAPRATSGNEASAVPSAPVEIATPDALGVPEAVLPFAPAAEAGSPPRLNLPLVPRRGTPQSETVFEAATEPAEIQAPMTPVQTSAESAPPVQTRAESAPPASTPTIQRVSSGELPDDSVPELRSLVRDSTPGREANSRVTATTLTLPPQLSRVSTVGAAANFGAPPAAIAPARSPATTLAPLVSARPLRPTAGVQRSAESASDAIAPISVAPAEGARTTGWTAGRRIDRSAAEALPRPTSVAATHAVDAPVLTERDPMAMLMPADDEPNIVTDDGHLPSLALASRARETQPGRRLESPAPSVQRLPIGLSRNELPLAPVAAGATAAVQRAAAAWEAQAMAAPTAGAAFVPSVMVQRAPEPEAPAVDGSPSSATGVTAAAASGDSEKDMDELAGKLYDRIRGRLRTELLVDRERAGLLTDWR